MLSLKEVTKLDIHLEVYEDKSDFGKRVTNATFVRQSTLHKILVDIVYDFLKEEVDKENEKLKGKFDDPNQPWYHSGLYIGTEICLKTGEYIKPDIINKRKNIAYEVHVKGERKGKYFDKLPDDWKGVNIFYDEEENEETLLIKLGTNEIKRIMWNNAKPRVIRTYLTEDEEMQNAANKAAEEVAKGIYDE